MDTQAISQVKLPKRMQRKRQQQAVAAPAPVATPEERRADALADLRRTVWRVIERTEDTRAAFIARVLARGVYDAIDGGEKAVEAEFEGALMGELYDAVRDLQALLAVPFDDVQAARWTDSAVRTFGLAYNVAATYATRPEDERELLAFQVVLRVLRAHWTRQVFQGSESGWSGRFRNELNILRHDALCRIVGQGFAWLREMERAVEHGLAA